MHREVVYKTYECKLLFETIDSAYSMGIQPMTY